MSFTIFQSKKTPFQAIKRRSSKSRNIDIFPTGLTHGFGSKMAIFSTFLFLGNIGRKMSLTIFQSEKTPFYDIKTRSSKSPYIEIFPKGLTHSFGQKMASFSTFFFRYFRPGKCLLRYSRAKKAIVGYKNRKFIKSKQFEIFANGLTHGFGPKMTSFPAFFFTQYRPGKCLL